MWELSSSSLNTGVSPVFLSFNQWCTSPLRLQASDCSTCMYVCMCDVPRMVVVCNESMECLPGIYSRYFLSPLVTVPVARMTTNITKHFIPHIHWTFMHNFLYFIFPLLYVLHCYQMALLSVCKFFKILFVIIICGLFAQTFISVCTPWLHNTVIFSCSHTVLGTYEYQLSGTSVPNSLHNE
jgi:hypothetical protein